MSMKEAAKWIMIMITGMVVSATIVISGWKACERVDYEIKETRLNAVPLHDCSGDTVSNVADISLKVNHVERTDMGMSALWNVTVTNNSKAMYVNVQYKTDYHNYRVRLGGNEAELCTLLFPGQVMEIPDLNDGIVDPHATDAFINITSASKVSR